MTTGETRFDPVVDNYRNVQPFVTEQRTIGEWTTEADAAAALDVVLDDCDLFDIHKEVIGDLIQPLPGQRCGPVRIDRILTPKPQLLRYGWDYGAIGVETKRSGEPIGPALNQMLDYRRSVFHLAVADIWLGFVFLWPARSQHFATESVMAHHRVGVAWSTDHYPLTLHSGRSVLTVDRTGSISLGQIRAGRKAGHR